MILKLPVTLAAAFLMTSSAAHASVAYPSSTDDARAAAALANPRSTVAAGGYTFLRAKEGQPEVPAAQPSAAERASSAGIASVYEGQPEIPVAGTVASPAGMSAIASVYEGQPELPTASGADRRHAAGSAPGSSKPDCCNG